MSGAALVVRRVEAADDRIVAGLVGVLVDCAEGVASVNFMLPLSRERSEAFWRNVLDATASGARTPRRRNRLR